MATDTSLRRAWVRMVRRSATDRIRERPGVPSGGVPGRFVVLDLYLPSV